MTYIDLFNVLCGFIIGYAVWNIIFIIKQTKNRALLDSKMNELRTGLEKLNNIGSPTVHKTDVNESDPFKAAYKLLTEGLGMPKDKVALHNNDNSLSIAYGHSCIVAIDRPTNGMLSVAIGIDKTTDQTEEERRQEFEELSAILTNTSFDRLSLPRALNELVIRVYKADKKKYSNVSRQIPREML